MADPFDPFANTTLTLPDTLTAGDFGRLREDIQKAPLHELRMLARALVDALESRDMRRADG